MSSNPDRYVAERARLAEILRSVRKTRFTSGSAAARALGWPQSKVSKLENGRILPSRDDVDTLLTTCQISGKARTEILELTQNLHTSVESNRTILGRGAARKQAQIARVEADASTLAYFSPSVIPGLLQTRDYMAAIFSLELSADDLARAIQARTSRQAALCDTAKSFTFVLTEAALRWGFARQIMPAQISRIAELSTHENITIGVIPLSTPVDEVPLHGFELFDNRLVTIGLEHAVVSVADPHDIATYTRLLDTLTRAARFDDDARDLLAGLAQAV